MLRSLSLLILAVLTPALPDASALQGEATPRAIQRKPKDLPFEDAEAVKRGQDGLLRMLDAAGGLVRFTDETKAPVHLVSRLPGVCFDTLEIGRFETKRGSGEWKTQYVVPHLVHLNGAGQGYLYSEYVADSKGTGYELVYRREVYAGQRSWGELGAYFLRDPDSERRARQNFLREVLLGYMPHSLTMLGAELAYRDEAEAEGRTLARFAVQMPRSVGLYSGEEIRWFDLFVDTETWEPVRMSYVPLGPLRRTIDIEFSGSLEMVTEGPLAETLVESMTAELRVQLQQQGAEQAAIDAAQVAVEDLILPRRLKIPFRRYMADNRSLEVISWETADWRPLALPAEALQSPWQTGEVWTPPFHADHWDPPASEEQVGPPAPEGN